MFLNQLILARIVLTVIRHEFHFFKEKLRKYLQTENMVSDV